MEAVAKCCASRFDKKICLLPNASGLGRGDGWVVFQNIGDSWFLGILEFHRNVWYTTFYVNW